MWKKIFMTLGIIGILGVAGCSNKVLDETDYVLCNTTSKNYMSETEEGFFYARDGFLYYADKENMSTWIPVCNKPDCLHEAEDLYETCNAYLPSYNQIVQKDGKLYGIYMKNGIIWVYEIQTDGSGFKTVYEVLTELETYSENTGFSVAVSQNQFLICYSYLDEKGITQYHLGRLDEDSFDILYRSDENVFLLSANVYYGIRGDDTYILNLPTESDTNMWNTLWRIENDSFKQINLPEDIQLAESVGAYLSDNTCTYFVSNEGFYQYDLTTGEKTLIYKNALENSRGYMFSSDYMVELNRYMDYSPEDASIKIYNKTEWIEVELLEEIKNSKNAFYPMAIASDRIFFSHTEQESSHLYYVLLDDEKPELVDCGLVGSVMESEDNTLESESTERVEQDTSDDIIIFDNEYCLLKVTDTYRKDQEYAIHTSLKMVGDWNRGEHESYYDVKLDAAIVNGIEYEIMDSYSEWEQLKEGKEEKEYIVSIGELKGMSDLYGIEDYTDIELFYSLKDNRTGEIIEKKSIHIYPQGEEHVEHYIREGQPTDNVLVDNDDITIIATEYEQNEIPNDTVTLFIQNKTEEGLYFVVPEASINGICSYRKMGGTDVDAFFVSPGSCAFRIMSYFEPDFLKNNEITSAGKIELLVKAYLCDASEKSAHTSKLLMNEHFILYPNGMEQSIHYERESQATDKVLVDNEKVTLILIGYADSELPKSLFVEKNTAKFYVVNKTEETIYFETKNSSINGIMCDTGRRGGTILPKNSAYIDVIYGTTVLKNVGIEVGTEMEFLINIFTENSNKNLVTEHVTLYPLGEEYINRYVRALGNNEEVLLDNEQFYVTTCQYEKNNDYIKLYMENKVGKDVIIKLDSILVDGVSYSTEEIQKNEWYISENTCSIENLRVSWDKVGHIDVTAESQIEFIFCAYEKDYENAESGEAFLSEKIMLKKP